MADHWDNLSRDDSADIIQLVTVVRDSAAERGGSAPYLALGQDGRRYWVKQVDSGPGVRALVAEQVVSACGRLIKAPVCETALVQFPAAFEGVTLSSGLTLSASVSHGSVDLGKVIFDKSYGPDNRSSDDNVFRHSRLIALHDWCWGDDLQYLYDPSRDMATFSHDHGFYFPGGPRWSEATLQQHLDVPPHPDLCPIGLNAEEIIGAAQALSQISGTDLVPILQRIPSSWDVSDNDLRALGRFLEHRIDGVIGRLVELAERL